VGGGGGGAGGGGAGAVPDGAVEMGAVRRGQEAPEAAPQAAGSRMRGPQGRAFREPGSQETET